MGKSKFLTLSQRDFLHGLVIAVLSAVGTFLAGELAANTPIDSHLWARVGIAALVGFFAYLGKNLFTNSRGEFGTEPKPPST